jgi:hypothetical protein
MAYGESSQMAGVQAAPARVARSGDVSNPSVLVRVLEKRFFRPSIATVGEDPRRGQVTSVLPTPVFEDEDDYRLVERIVGPGVASI